MSVSLPSMGAMSIASRSDPEVHKAKFCISVVRLAAVPTGGWPHTDHPVGCVLSFLDNRVMRELPTGTFVGPFQAPPWRAALAEPIPGRDR